jgi:hypothetical protein
MASESAIFTALPNGVINGDHLGVTVFVSPRLSTGGAGELPLTGGDFPAFEDWPTTLDDIVFSILFESLGTLDPDPDPAPPWTSSTWRLLFDRTAVRDAPFQDHSDRKVLSFPVRGVADRVLDLYRLAAEGSPTSFPPVAGSLLSDLADGIGAVGRNPDRWDGLLNEYISMEIGPRPKENRKQKDREQRRGRYLQRNQIPDAMKEQATFAEAYRFYVRPGSREPSPSSLPWPPSSTPQPPPAPEVPKIDFHGFVGFCGDYPKLLRQLGLAVDLLVPFRPGRVKELGRIRVEFRRSAAPWMDEEQSRPWTNYELSDDRFVPRPRDPEGDTADGMLVLEHERYFLVNELDLDGSALKVVDFAANLSRVKDELEGKTRSMTDDASSLPALRSGGFTISRDGRAGRTVGQFDHAADHDSDHASEAPADLFAEDVTRGYRLDVEDLNVAGRWLSLHQRVGRYTVGPPDDPSSVELQVEPDEAYVKGASTSSVPGQNDLYLHETVVGWEGWSLAAKRPGNAITDAETAEDIPPDNPTDFPLYTEFKAPPGTLPRLRFGRSYRFRVRTADLAGNSVLEKFLEPNHVSKDHPFLRFDPVPAPAVIPRRPFTEGESLLRMVIRSTLGLLPDRYVAQDRIKNLTHHTDPLLAYLVENERHVAPPISSQQLAEWHGKFDPGIGQGASPQAVQRQYQTSALESGSFLDPGPGASVFNPDPNATPTDLADPNRKKGAPLKPGEYVRHDTDDLKLPYLPDPLTAGASFTRLPGDTDTRTLAWEGRFQQDDKAWFERLPFRIRIEDGNGAPAYSKAERLLTVFLPQAEMVTVQLSSFFADVTDLDLLAVWMMQDAGIRFFRKGDAVRGLHWMLSPWHLLTLVHAVEKPLEPPTVNVPSGGVNRRVGETFAVLSGTIGNHAKSTGRLDIEATWREPVDDLANPGPTENEGAGHVGDFQLGPTEDACRIDRDDVPPLGSSPAVHKVRHEFGDTKHRCVKYHAMATTRFREYFPPEITDKPELITHVGDEVELNVPSSRRPDPPNVLYVVPTWTWRDSHQLGLSVAGRRRAPSTSFRTRTGGGLRVYLDRPWYSSGEGELLGVVLEDQPWLTWFTDLARGLAVSGVARARAEDVAERAMVDGAVKGHGRASSPATERMLAGVRREAATPMRTRTLSANLSTADRAMASHRAAESAMNLGTGNGDGELGLFTMNELALLSGIVGKYILISGDPKKFVTHWGLDPIWGSAPVHDGPYIHQFPLRVAVGTDISLLEAPGHQVAVVGHKPEFDPLRKLWYCDIQIDAGPSYFPFVKMALARYQPDSIPGQHLSAVVMADFAQLVAERTSAITRMGASSAYISLHGPGGYTETGKQMAATYGDVESAVELSRFAVAQVERLPAGADTDLAWTPVGDEAHLALSTPGGVADIRYEGRVFVPKPEKGDQLRVAVREYEIFLTDESEHDGHIERTYYGEFPYTMSQPVKYRLVYADYLPL